jgi:asparagine synthase (glutamine-hydrolysing)
MEASLIQSLPKMIWHLDEPSDPIAACQFYAAELASRYVKVVLGGDGGDELFAGFDRYLGLGYIEHYNLIPAFIRHHLIGPSLGYLPDTFAYKNLTQKARWTHQLSLLPTVAERYAEATCFFRFNHQGKQLLWSDDLWERVGHLNSAEVIVSQFNAARANDVLDRMLYADYMTRLPEHSLMLTDRMTMAHGLEARSPYLDHELVEFVARFPSGLKIYKRELKVALRRLAGEYLPGQIVKREKQGFMFPVAYWFKNELYPFIRRILMEAYFVRTGIFKPGCISRLIDEHHTGRVDHHVRLWMLLNLGVWYRLYIEQDEPELISNQMESFI